MRADLAQALRKADYGVLALAATLILVNGIGLPWVFGWLS